MRARVGRSLVLVGLLGVVFAVFSPALEGAFIWDDHPLIEQNFFIAHGEHLGRVMDWPFWDVGVVEENVGVYYRPLVTLSYMLDYRIHGLDPRGDHRTNLVLHLLACLAAFLLLRRLLGGAQLAAVIATLLWALHPSRAEAVAWISGRCDVMMGLFAILALLAFWRALECMGPRKIVLAGLGWLAYAAAIVSKESAVAVALMVPALDLLLVSGASGDRRRLLRNCLAFHAPLVIVSAAYLVARLSQVESHPLRLVRRLWLFLQTAAHYALIVVNPYAQSALRGQAQELVHPNPPLVALGIASVLALCVLVAGPFLRRFPRARLGLILFALGLGPVLNLRPLGIGYMVAERFLYLPILGLALLGGLWAASSRPWIQRSAIVLLGGLACSYAVADHRRSADFQNEERFWRRELELHPRSALALEHLGSKLVAERRYLEAERVHLRAFGLRMEDRAIDSALGDWQRALETRLLRTSDGDPFLEQAASFLRGLLAARQGGPAVKGCIDRHCVNVQPRSAAVRKWIQAERANLLVSLGAISSRLGDDAAAIRQLDESLSLKPGRLAPLLNRGLARLRARDLQGAERDLAAVRAKLPDAREVRSLGETLRAAAPILHALARFGPEPERSPEVDAHRLLTQLFIVAKAPRRAERALREVVRLAPTDAEARALLAYEVAILGRPAEARALIEAARRELGDNPHLRRVELELGRLATPR